MKKIILVAALAAFVFASCNNSASSAHTHDDGSDHSDCDHQHADAQHQEVFEVEADSTHDCSHDSLGNHEGHSHSH